MGKRSDGFDEFADYGKEVSSPGKEVSNFSEPSSKKIPEVPSSSIKETKPIEPAAKPTKAKVAKNVTSFKTLTSLLTVAVATGGTVVTTTVALSAFYLDVNLFSANANSLVFEIAANNLPEDEELFVKLVNEEQEYYYDFPITEERYYAFYDLEPSSPYTLKIFRNEKIEYTGIFKTIEEYVESAFVEVMSYEYGHLDFFVYNPDLETHPILTVQAKQLGKDLLLNQDSREEQSFFEVTSFKPLEPIYISVSYLGTGVGYLYLEPLGEEPEPEPEPEPEESSSSEDSYPDESSSEEYSEESSEESSEEYSEESSEGSSEESSEESSSESSEESSTSLPEMSLILTEDYQEIGYDSFSLAFIYNDLEKAERAEAYLDGGVLEDITFDSESDHIYFSKSGLEAGTDYHFEVVCDDELVYAMTISTPPLATVETMDDGTSSFFILTFNAETMEAFGDNDHIFRFMDGFGNILHEEFLFDPTSGDGSGRAAEDPQERKYEIWPNEAIFQEVYTLMVYDVDHANGDVAGNVLGTQSYQVDGQMRLSMSLNCTGTILTLSNFNGYYKASYSFYTFRLEGENGYEVETMAYLPASSETLEIDLETGGVDGQPGSYDETVENGTYKLTILNGEEKVYTSEFEVHK